MGKGQMIVRDATLEDLPAIVSIYNESVPGRRSTADTNPVTVESRYAWFHQHDPERRPLWVLERKGEIVAWISLEWFYHARPAYHSTAEVSFYVAGDHQRKGYGTMLLNQVISKCPELGISTVLAFFFEHNEATAKLTERMGFERVGHLKEVADLDGEKKGLVISGLKVPSVQGTADSQGVPRV